MLSGFYASLSAACPFFVSHYAFINRSPNGNLEARMRSIRTSRVSRGVFACVILSAMTVASPVAVGRGRNVHEHPQRTFVIAHFSPAPGIVTSEAEELHPQVCAIMGNFGSPTGPVVERCSGV